MSKICSCCGQPIPVLPGVDLTVSQSRIYEAVSKAGSRGVRSSTLIDRLYGDHPDGGPLTAAIALRVHVYYLNIRLRAVGQRIRAMGSGNGSEGIYRLYTVLPEAG